MATAPPPPTLSLIEAHFLSILFTPFFVEHFNIEINISIELQSVFLLDFGLSVKADWCPISILVSFVPDFNLTLCLRGRLYGAKFLNFYLIVR